MSEPEIFDRPVGELDLSVRAHNCLQYAGIRTVRDLVQKTEAGLLKSRNFGRKSLAELREVLTELGLHFGMQPGEKPGEPRKLVREAFASIEQLRMAIQAQGKVPLSDMERDMLLDLAQRDPQGARQWLANDLRRQEKAEKEALQEQARRLRLREGRSIAAMLIGSDPSGHGRLLDEAFPDEAPHQPGPERINAARDAIAAAIQRSPQPARVAAMVNGRFGLNGGEVRTYRDLGEELGIGHERVRQVMMMVVRRTREALQRQDVVARRETRLDEALMGMGQTPKCAASRSARG